MTFKTLSVKHPEVSEYMTGITDHDVLTQDLYVVSCIFLAPRATVVSRSMMCSWLPCMTWFRC